MIIPDIRNVYPLWFFYIFSSERFKKFPLQMWIKTNARTFFNQKYQFPLQTSTTNLKNTVESESYCGFITLSTNLKAKFLWIKKITPSTKCKFVGIKGQYINKCFCTYTWYDDHTFKISLINLTIKSKKNGTRQLLMKPQLTNFTEKSNLLLLFNWPVNNIIEQTVQRY